MPDKLTALKIKQPDGTYSSQIPIGVHADNVTYNDDYTLKTVLGSVDMTKGSLQSQINTKVGPEYVEGQISEDVTDWLNDNVNPVGSAVTVDNSLTIAGSAADAKITGEKITNLLDNLENYNSFELWQPEATDSYQSPREGTKEIKFEKSGENLYTVTQLPGIEATTQYHGYRLSKPVPVVPQSTMPSSIIPGETYYVKYHTTDRNVRFRIIFMDAGGNLISPYFYCVEDSLMTVPLNAVDWAILLIVFPNVTLPNPVVVSDVHIFAVKTNNEIDIESTGKIEASINALNSGSLTITKSNMESGWWGYGTKFQTFVNNYTSSRIRTKQLIQIKAGTVVRYNFSSDFEIFLGMLATPNSVSWIKSSASTLYHDNPTSLSWTQCTGQEESFFINEDGYLAIMLRKYNQGLITVDDYNDSIIIESPAFTSLFNDNLTCQIFRRVVCCGDSYTAGYIRINQPTGTPRIMTYEKYAWPHYMELLTGNKWENCGSSGANVITWQTAARGLPKARSLGKVQAYVIGLMINDINNTPIGNIEDIGTETGTYYAQMSKIVRQLNGINPLAKIFINTCPRSRLFPDSYLPYNKAVRDIVNVYKNTYPVHLIDLEKYSYLYYSSTLSKDYKSDHYTSIGYEMFAKIYAYILSKYIDQHVEDFQNVHLIPCDVKEDSDLIEDLQEHNSYNIFNKCFLMREDGDSNGASFRWFDDNTCRIYTTSSGVPQNSTGYNHLISKVNSGWPLPSDIKPGKKYFVCFSSPNPNVRLSIQFADSQGVVTPRNVSKHFTSNDWITVPEDAVAWHVYLVVMPGTIISSNNPVTIDGNIKLLSTLTNEDLKNKVNFLEVEKPIYIAMGASTTEGSVHSYNPNESNSDIIVTRSSVYNYPAYTGQVLGLETINLAVGGSGYIARVANRNVNGTYYYDDNNYMDILLNANNQEIFSQAKLITLQTTYGNDGNLKLSSADTRTGMPVGEYNDYYPYDESGYHISDMSRTPAQGELGVQEMINKGATFMGCMNWCIKYIGEHFPLAQLILINGHFCWNTGSVIGDDKNSGKVIIETDPISNKRSLKIIPRSPFYGDVDEKVTRLAKALNIPLIDLHSEGEPYTYYGAQAKDANGDYILFSTVKQNGNKILNTHPTDLGYLLFARYFAGRIASYYYR